MILFFFLSSWSAVSLDHFGAKLPSVEKCVIPNTWIIMWESVSPFFFLSDRMLVTKALDEGTRPYFFFFTFYPACCKLAGLHRALFEVFCEHKSLLIKVPCSENDLNKHSPRIIPSLGSSNLPQNGCWGQERLEATLWREYLRMWWFGVAEHSHLVNNFVQSASKQNEWLHF